MSPESIERAQQPVADGRLQSVLQSQQASSAWLRVLFEGHPDMLVVADANARIMAVNSATLAGFGYERDDLIGEPIDILVPDSARQRHAGHVELFLEHPTPRAMGAGIALKARHASGIEFPVDVMLKPFAAGDEQYVMAVCRRLDDAAARSQVQIQALVESVRDYAINLLDAQGRILTWNEGSRRIHGMSATEALGQNISIFFFPADLERREPEKLLQEAARAGHHHTAGWRRGANGNAIWAEVDFTAIRDASGQITGFTRVLHDMTAHRKAEESLRKLNAELEQYRIIVDNLEDYALYTLDAKGRIASWGIGAQKVIGYPPDDVLGQPYSMFSSAEDLALGTPQRQLEEAARSGRCITDNWRIARNGERQWSSGVLSALRDEAGALKGFIRVTRDMTRQKMLEESLANLNSQLEQRIAERTHQLEATVKELRRKNEEVEAFVYTVSHDLRAPLVNVQGFARELEESCASLKSKLALWDLPAREREAVQVILDEDIAGALRFISASSAKFERLIDALLGLSRHGRQVYRMVQVDVQELVVSTMATLQQLIAEAGASIRVGKLPPVTADMTALGQVFSNLIGNCLKYRSPLRPLEVEVGGEVDGEGVRYWVRDNGLGIPESGKAKLFQVFLRLHPKQAAGEGMGLAIVHRIVERHGGKIWAESQDGQGTTFFFFMPAEPDGAAAAGEEELSNEP